MHEGRADRQLRRCERERLPGERLVAAVHLVEHLAGDDLGHVILRAALAIAHADFRRLTRDGLVREDADPDAAAALDVTRHRAPCSFDLARREAAAADGFKAVLAEAHLVADGRNALVAPLLFLAVLPSSWLQHSSLLAAGYGADASAPRAPVRARLRVRRCAP